MAEIYVKGLKELQQFLNVLPAKMEANVMRGAMRAGAKVLNDYAKERAPIGQPRSGSKRRYGGYPGALRDSLRIGTRLNYGTVIARVIAGGKNKKTGADVFYAHMIEFGTKAHTITARNGGMLAFGGGFHKSVEHPGIKPKPFMRPALDTQATRAVIAVANAIKKRLLKKHGLDLTYIKVEGDE